MTQRNAMRVWDEGGEYKDLVLADKEIRDRLSAEEIEKAFSIKRILRVNPRVPSIQDIEAIYRAAL